MKHIMTKLFTRVAMIAMLFITVFAETARAADITDVIDNAATSSYLGNTATSTWATNFTITGTSGVSYYIHSMGTKSTSNALQWNANGFLYMTTTRSGYKLKSISISTTANKNISIFAQNSAYSASPTGTALATLAATSSGNTYSFTSEYSYLALKGTASSTSITNITIVWEEKSKTPSDLALTDAPVSLNFDLHNNSGAQTVSYTTSSTGAVTVSGAASYVTTDVNSSTKTITVTPTAFSYSAQTVTVSQAEDDTYAAGSATFTVNVADSTPFAGGDVTFDATRESGSSPLQKNGVTFSCDNGVLNNGSEYRLYKSSVTTFSVSEGAITQIAFTGVSGNPASGFSSQAGWTTDGNNGTWTGAAQSVSFTASGAKVRCTIINVYYTAPQAATDVYVMGMINGNGEYPTRAVKMTYDGTNYTAKIWVIGNNENAMDQVGSWMAFTTVLADNNDSGGWSYVNSNRYSPTLGQDDDYYWLTNGVVSNVPLTKQNNDKAFLIPAGLYEITVSGDLSTFSLNTVKDLKPTINPNGGEVTQNSSATVAISENFNTFIADCNPVVYANGTAVNDITAPTAKFYLNNELVDGTSTTYQFTNTGSVTLTGKCTLEANNNEYATKTATATFNVSAASAENVYVLVESEDDLVADGEYIIAGGAANEPYTVLMGAVSGNIGTSVTTGFTYNASAKTMTLTDGCDAQILTLGGSTGAWTFYTGSAYLSLTSSANNLNTSATADATNAKWTINVGNLPLSKQLIANNQYTTRYLEYNSGSPRFACYTGSQQAVALFKKAVTSNKSTMPTITPATCNVKGGLLEGVMIEAAQGATIYYTLDGTDPTTESSVFNGEAFDVTGTGGQTKYVKAIAVETGKEPSNVATAAYTFQAPSNPVITPDGGTYAGTQLVTISSSDGGIIYYLVDPDPVPENAAGVISANQVYTAGTTAITLEVGTHKVFAAVDLNGITSWAQESYTITADPMTLSFSPAAGTYVNAQSVTITANNAVGDYTIYYTTDGTEATANSAVYTGPISVNEDMTINAYAVDSRENGLEGKEATASATYNIGVQPVEYSPIPGNYYVGDDGDITVEMFSVTPNAKVYYTMTDDGSEPADPTTSSTLYTGDIPLETGKTYNFKAIAVAGQQTTAIAPATYTIGAMPNSGWVDIDAMNKDNNYDTDDVLLNPVQVVYMSTHRNNGTKPEFCFVRDNSGYGMVYFGGTNVHDYDNWAKFQMGDWLPGNKISGTLNVWSDSFINELGGSSGTLSTWPSANEKLGNSDILPEETTNLAITQGWTYEGAYSGTDYAQFIDADKNLFGHYVHMRKNTITNVAGSGGGQQKHAGIITDQSGVPLNYYDGLYLFSGYNNTPDYNQAFFDNIQNNGGTFDIYAIVYFYGTNASKEEYSYAPYEIFPIDFMWIYKPLFSIPEGTYMESQTVTLTCATEGAQIWYKTSEMEDFALYTGPITVDATTTIEAYSTIPTKYNDVMESAINSITINIGSIEAPVITQESIVKTVGESTSTTITCETDGATIYYTIDGSDPKTSSTRQVYTEELTFTTTTTVRAIAYQEVEGTGYYSAEAEARTYTFVESNGIIYDLVTSDSQLNENDVYVIVNKANNMALGTTQNTNNRNASGVMFVENTNKTQVYGNDDVAQFTLKKVGNNWYIQTNNSSVNGSLCVGNGNTLLTGATADGNAEATISIDGNSEAHISFMYNYETMRYLRYFNSGKAFSTYTSENSNLPVALYRRVVTSLANIEKEGTQGEQYTVADRLLVVAASKTETESVIWAKDEGNVSIAKTEIKKINDVDQIDYMKFVAGNDMNQQAEVAFQDPESEWDQSNWVMIKLLESDDNYNTPSVYEGNYILPASLTGKYTDDENYTIEALVSLKDMVDATGGDYTPNVFCAANFLDANLNLTDESTGAAGTGGRYYFFVNPKVQEVATITYAVWDGTKFVMPARNDAGTINGAGIAGAFSVNFKYNTGASEEDLVANQAYQFRGVLNKVATQGNAPRRAEGSEVAPGNFGADPGKVVYPIDLKASDIVTEVRDLNGGVREVASVKYVSVTGVVSDKPFEGMNIIVTRYTDGTTSTTKVMR